MKLLTTWLSLLLPVLVSAKGPACCQDVQNDKCRKSCNQVQEQVSPIPQMQLLLTAAEGCPPEMTDFWQCVNDTLPAVQMLSVWPWKACCDLARAKECRKRCNSADTKDAMMKFCREVSEPSLFSCIQRQEAGHQCCSKATSSCGVVCQGIYITGGGSTRASRTILAQHCNFMNKRVEQCVNKQWHPPSENTENTLPCCDKAENADCRTTCRTVLQSVMSEDDRIDELIQACSQPQPTDPLWQCFLHNQNSKKNETSPMSRIDNAKLQCCGKASSSRCRDLCAQTYRNVWSYHADFESSCSYLQPVSTLESHMHNCLMDVEQPCRLGCSGLSFCSNFNHRSTELFRSCTPEADEAAQKAYNSWKNGVIHLPQMTIPVKDITQCKPSMWKAIACALEVKPCTSQQSLITLCKEDCLYILTKCVDASKLSGDKTVPALCNALPSRNTAGTCISVATYLVDPRDQTPRSSEVNHPCNPNPCSQDEVCMVRRRKCKHHTDCLPYVCHKACPLGQVSKVLIPKGTNVRLININESPTEEECHVTCHCSSRGVIEGCKPLTCMKRDACVLGHENIKEHGDQFIVDGSQCVCYSGKVLCTRRSCHPDSQSPLYTGMPGNCPTEFEPVCGVNGKTYPNACMAKCAGVTYHARKACSDEDVCSHRTCPPGSKCVPRHQVCLNDLTMETCAQFECVGGTDSCSSHIHDPVCSSSGEEFSNICLLYSHRQTLGYRGHCQTGCSNMGVVCGHDGETYSSECAARAARITVDYFSKCQAFGNMTATGNLGKKTASCSRVKCPHVYPSDCVAIVPPGACCPICAAQIKLLWDSRLMTAAANHAKFKIISAADILNSLSDHVSVAECDVFGYVSISGELIVLVASVVSQPSVRQVEACQTEAWRIHRLLQMGSPNLVSYLTLSPLLVSTLDRSVLPSPVQHPMYMSDPYNPSDLGDSHASLQVAHMPSSLICLIFIVICLKLLLRSV